MVWQFDIDFNKGIDLIFGVGWRFLQSGWLINIDKSSPSVSTSIFKEGNRFVYHVLVFLY